MIETREAITDLPIPYPAPFGLCVAPLTSSNRSFNGSVSLIMEAYSLRRRCAVERSGRCLLPRRRRSRRSPHTPSHRPSRRLSSCLSLTRPVFSSPPVEHVCSLPTQIRHLRCPHSDLKTSPAVGDHCPPCEDSYPSGAQCSSSTAHQCTDRSYCTRIDTH